MSGTDDLLGLAGKRALVTGGSRGVGRAVCRLLAQAGARVGFGYRRRKAAAEEVLGELRDLGAEAWAEPGDLTEAADVERLFARVDQAFGGLDVFIGNHGIWPSGDVAIQDMSDQRWRETLAVNLHSIFTTTREAARRVADGGRIVLVSSTAGQRGEAYHVDYAATKGAIISMVKGLCVELGPRAVTVNAVAPGWIETEMAEPAYGDGGRERIAASIPLRRIASAEDVAGPILFLCSRLGRHVTGEILNVNGGSVLAG